MTEDRWARPGRRAWIPDELAGRYEIERELGAGAAAVTVAARDRRLGRRVAIKILKPEEERDAGFARRFTREAQAAAAINHPNVVSVYDVGQEGDLYYLVMQLVDGTDLRGLIAQEGALPWPRAVAIARDVLAGLGAIHAAGIVHRDIKPQNVLIGRDGSVQVTDFGVAHVERDTSLTAAGTTVGTADYMAPEQAQGQAPTPAADVYAVGVMLYEMVTGRLPYHETSAMATMLAHIQREAPAPAAPRGRDPVPRGVVLAIQQAMAKDPGRRFRGAEAMRNALEFPDAVGATPPVASSRTEVVPSVLRPAPRPRPARAASVGRSGQAAPVAERSARGFAGPFVAVLVVLAVALVAVAGTLWLLEDRPDLFGGGDDPSATATVAAPTDAPAVIEPVETAAPLPTPTPTLPPEPSPTPTPEPTPTPSPETEPTQPVIEPPTPTSPPINPSTDDGEPQMIEPMDGSTVVPDSQG